MPRRAAVKSNRWLKVVLWTGGILVTLTIAALLIGQLWLNRYLRSAEFRREIENKSGRNIRAQVEIAPIRFEGAQFSCESFVARGAQDAGFSLAKIEDIRGEVSLPSVVSAIFGNPKVRVPRLEIQRLTLEMYPRDRLDLSLPEKENRGHQSGIEHLHIREARLSWGGGGLSGTSVHAKPVEGGWKIEGEGGRFIQLGLPPIDLVSARITRKDRSLFIQEARLRHDGGEVSATGEILSGEKADALLKLSNVQVTPFLPEDWRARLHGQLFGELRMQLRLDVPGKLNSIVSGPLRMEKGVLEGLPVLNKIADYLRTDQFRRVDLSQASANVHYEAKRLRVENLVLESKQLMVIRGGFTYADGNVDGTFEVGITPGPLQWLPGSQEKVFTVQRDGYVWAPMKVTGPPNALKEDLSGRLITAAQGAVVDQVEKTANQALDTAVDTAKKGANGVLDLLFGK